MLFVFQIQSNLGKIILKEELQKSAAVLRRKTRSLPDHSHSAGTHTHRESAACHGSRFLMPSFPYGWMLSAFLRESSHPPASSASRSVYFPAPSRSGLARVSVSERSMLPCGQQSGHMSVFVSSCRQQSSAPLRKLLQVHNRELYTRFKHMYLHTYMFTHIVFIHIIILLKYWQK